MSSAATGLAHLAWLLSTLPRHVAFTAATRDPHRAQLRVLRDILAANRDTAFGREHGFATIRTYDEFRRAVPLSDYADGAAGIGRIRAGERGVLCAEPVRLLQPTSGTTAGSKLIPLTAGLQRQFRAALDPWIAGLYLRHPSLLLGRQYWSVSPNTRSAETNTPTPAVPTGFADDADYLGPVARALCARLLAAPADLARVGSPEAFEYATLLFLARAADLRLISVWHPSFLTLLLDALPRHFASLVDDIRRGGIRADLPLAPEQRARWLPRLRADSGRAGRLARLDPTHPSCAARLWPRLRVISCWADGSSAPWAARLAAAFPGVTVEPKGLVATEGIVSVPVGRAGERVCALRSHFLEFLDRATGEARGAWQLEADREYTVALTTAGGLYRYRLHDIVRVTGFYRHAPCLGFVAREGQTCDLVGEKLDGAHVEAALAAAERRFGVTFAFALLAPRPAGSVTGAAAGYALHLRADNGPSRAWEALAEFVDAELCRNFHYRHARALGQLAPLIAREAPSDAVRRYRDRCMATGTRAGDVKFLRLRCEDDWDLILGTRP